MTSKRIYILVFILLTGMAVLRAQGLRHSVGIVMPEYEKADKEFFGDYALYTARAGMRNASRMLTAYKSDEFFGSGVVVAHGGKKYVLTNLHVVGYAQTATVVFQLHDRTLRYPQCPVVQTNAGTDLAALALPAECEMNALPLFAGEINEDLSIVAAGFPELAGKPSWQMTRGSISNAQVSVDADAIRIIQHTASIDPGSSGGPLLYKDEEGKYAVLGVNTWKAFYREGVGLAVGKEDIDSFLGTLGSPAPNARQDIAPLRKLSAEEWLFIFRNLPEKTQTEIKESDWQLPLDPALQALAARDSIVNADRKQAKHFDSSASRIVKQDRRKHFRLVYDNYFSVNQQITVQVGFFWFDYLETGVQIGALIADVMTEDPSLGSQTGYAVRGGAMFGLYVGGQLPISVGKYRLVPQITQSANGGPFKTGNIYGGYALMTDTRAGVDWRVPLRSCEFILGVHYDMNWLFTKDQMNMTPYKVQADHDSFNHYLQHGVGINVGVAW